jgi:hypothetical protein
MVLGRVCSSEIGLHVHKVDLSPANSRFYETVWKSLGMIENRDDLCRGESTFFHSGVWSDPYNLSALFMPSLQSNRNLARCTGDDFVANTEKCSHEHK